MEKEYQKPEVEVIKLVSEAIMDAELGTSGDKFPLPNE